MATPPPLSQTIAANVRRLRERAGLTQSEFAELVARDARWIRRVESGTLDLRLSTIEMLAGALGVKPGVLLRAARLVRREAGRPVVSVKRRSRR